MGLSNILIELNFEESDFEQKENNILEYESNLGTINFFELTGATDVEITKNFYNAHSDIWNENKSEIFVAIKEDEIFICDSKTKPESSDQNPIRTAKIKSFKYGSGDNTPEAEYYLRLLQKESITSGYFWEKFYGLIRKRIREKKRKPIDIDLLKNLTDKKEKILKYLKRFDSKDEIAQKLIDRCLFIRFLEDRIGRNELKDLLERKDVKGILDLFTHYNHYLNGDLFEEGDIPNDIPEQILDELNDIFGEYYKYTGNTGRKQLALVPYQFDKIPILLISQIYEQFLNPDRRRGEGIVFTPENVAEYIIEKVFESESIKNKDKGGNITILDPSCGSGIFLVKFFERLVKERESELGKNLDIYEKSDLLKNSVYGIDTDPNALRIAAFSLYLNIFDGVNPEILNKEFKKYEEKKEHFMFPVLKERNLIHGNSLFDEDIFKDEKFDLILGNPPWGYDFSENERRLIDRKWPDVSDYQSSQCFLFKIDDWMDEDSIVGMVVNLSNFTNQNANDFRKLLLEKYSIKKFLNLMNITKITFGSGSEPACVLLFNKRRDSEETEIEFIMPDMTQFSELTNIIVTKAGDKARVLESKLLDDELWHLCILGMNRYRKLIERIEEENNPLIDYSDPDRFNVGVTICSTEEQGDTDLAKQEYESTKKINDNYYPLVRAFGFIEPYLFTSPELYINYEDPSKFHRGVDLDLFIGDKLVIKMSSWPLKAFSVRDTVIFNNLFAVFKLKKDQDTNYLNLFEAILNSKLAHFYLASRYLQRPEGNYTKINFREHLKKFPIPDLKDEKIIKEIINFVTKIKEEKDIEKYQDQIDDLVFDLYDLDYYERQQIKDYHKIQKRKRNNLVTVGDMQEYAHEFIEGI
ncbi:MAG: hypothetical protein CVT90_00820, partial [Candidatus Altiarchaeales archaeon HGW-Altiarchaeales-3]